MEYVLFNVSGQTYGMGIENLVGIEEVEHVTPVADAPGYITGITNVRGQIVPVFDLAAKFSADSDKNEKNYLLVNLDGTQVCLATDEVVGMKNFAAADVFETPKVINNEIEYFVEVLKLEKNQLALVIEPNVLISQDERKSISEFVSDME